MQLHAGRMMTAHGYSPEPLGFSLGDWLRFSCLDWPVNLSRMLAWRTMETLHQKFPSLVRRTANPKMILSEAA